MAPRRSGAAVGPEPTTGSWHQRGSPVPQNRPVPSEPDAATGSEATRRSRPSPIWGLVIGAVVALIAVVAIVEGRGDGGDPAAVEPTAATAVDEAEPMVTVPAEPWSLEVPTRPMTVDPYVGLGAWVDVFDFDPAYQERAEAPVVTVADLDVMAALGVETLYLQAARFDAERTPDGLVTPDLVAEFLDAAHDRGIAVVAWYLPLFGDVDADADRLDMLRRFRTGRGDRFDGVAVDIEATATVDDDAERSQRLVELSTRMRALGLPDDAWGAIVLPPTLLEVVNTEFWPGFPWAELAPLYDVWLPMSYWSGRTEASGLRDGQAYNDDAVARLRANLDDDDALVHSIGGIGDAITEAQVADFVTSLTATASIGGSIYDYRTTSAGAWALLRDRVPTAVTDP